ncbi:TPA: phage baseplate assembly protein V [Morganella morganii]|uniref:phage baseplate assembly protein V n=1 Tax=Morganella morganii TaxID=582 RepID=UPI000F8450BD|nr:phage baseplate assembly protein V [Morganella morganii]ELA9133445.1 phage baseplate assembly protein V [Morganella morganii]RTY22135.1 phage baseplate assembly protein V [Morganella morganii subsp. morganii]HDU8627212.1 phage baseplate assembly protein V [Morganella morganii]
MTLNELERLISNLLRVGVIEEVNTEKMVCRVRTGDILTDWIRWGADRAGAGRSWWAPVAGEQVIIGAVNGELTTAFVLCSLYSDKNSAPSHSAQAMHKTFSDGAVIEYEPETGELTVTGIQKATVNAAQKIDATAPEVTVTASTQINFNTPKVVCSDNLTCATLNVEKGGEMTGDITHKDGHFSSNGVVVDNHSHGGVERGGSWTDGIK